MADHSRMQRVIDAIDGTRTAREIANALGEVPSYVRNLARRKRLRLAVGMSSKSKSALGLMDGTHTARQIADLTGVHVNYVHQLSRRHGLVGALRLARGRVLDDGGIVATFRFSPEVAAWLRAQQAPGVTMIDVIRAVLVDAWADDLDAAEERRGVAA